MVIRILILGLLAAALPMAGAVAAGLKEKVTVSKQDCRWLVNHQPAADVAYQPGVGVRGRQVKSADLDSNQRINLPPVIAIPLHVPVRRLLKGGAANPIGDSEVGVGLVTVDRNSGEIRYEGETLVSDDESRLVAACRDLLRRSR